jgi:hypothetical protein
VSHLQTQVVNIIFFLCIRFEAGNDIDDLRLQMGHPVSAKGNFFFFLIFYEK